MRKLILAIAFAAAAFMAVEPALSQVRFRNYGAPRPRIQRQIKPPPILLIPPSVAVKNVQMLNPGARIIGVRQAGRSRYIVKFKQGNRVMRAQVDGATGAVLP